MQSMTQPRGFTFYVGHLFYGIRASSREPDGVEVFGSFRGAKAALIKELIGRREQYSQSVRDAQRLLPEDTEPEESE
jgi:hypothetical protein